MKKILCLAAFTFFVISIAFIISEIYAQDESDKEEFVKDAVDKNRIDAAVKKAVQYLKSKQLAEGSWGDMNELFAMAYPEGLTALCLYALLKGGETENSDCIKKGFESLKRWWSSNNRKTVYGTSCIILALCSLYEPDEKGEKEEEIIKDGGKLKTTAFDPYEKRLKQGFRKNAPAWVKNWLDECVKWIVSQQQTNVWRYPGANPGATGGPGLQEDASNSQYAMLALYTAISVGVKVQSGVFKKVAEYFIADQEKQGPEVKPFRVPAADFDVAQLKELEKEFLENMKKSAEDAIKAGDDPAKVMEELKTSSEIADPYEKYGTELGKMNARGWGYVRHDANSKLIPEGAQSEWCDATGSMTTSGVIALVICKTEIEKSINSKVKQMLNQSIRDGCAWLAYNWSVTHNPKSNNWKMYYLYGLERVGVLTLCNKFGDHKWFKEGAEHLFSTQKSDGSWPGDKENPRWMNGTLGYGDLCSTCFGILFLKRATAPIIKPPGNIYTGEDLLGGSKKKE
ncbi:MAG: prenyltransferase/squalene oxidase repeat-containing protein [Planctomycetota bacterium]